MHRDWFRSCCNPAPYLWQTRLFDELLHGAPPSALVVPTGGGKTLGFMRAWLFALAWSLKQGRKDLIARRLVWVVNRRVVVDQASDDAAQLALALQNAQEGPLFEAAQILRQNGGSNRPLESYVLRGQRTIEDAWEENPAQPAILVGTVDMLGSRLLFSGYGTRDSRRAHVAGLLGQDTLWVVDEPHLCTAFCESLTNIQTLNQQFPRPFAVTFVGATQQATGATFRLSTEETKDPAIQKRLTASKTISYLDDPKPLERIVTLAKSSQKAGQPVTVIVADTVVNARHLYKHLKGPRTFCVTGAMRGVDRDKVVDDPDFQNTFIGGNTHGKPAILVTTSCVEVGFNIDCSCIIAEPRDAFSLVQLLGRLNRSGRWKETTLTLVCCEMRIKAGPRLTTWEWIKTLCSSGSCPADLLKGIPAKFAALPEADRNRMVEPPPVAPLLTEPVLASLTWTSHRKQITHRPDVHRFLWGTAPEDDYSVYVAWRADLDYLRKATDAAVVSAMEFYPVASKEMTRCSIADATSFVMSRPDGRFVLVRGDKTLIRPGGERPFLQPGDVIVVPSSLGGYDGTFLDPDEFRTVTDVASVARPITRPAIIRASAGYGNLQIEGEAEFPLVGPLDSEALESVLAEVAERYPRAEIPPEEVIAQTGYILIKVPPAKSARRFTPVSLNDHNSRVGSKAEQIAQQLGLPAELTKTIVEAAAHHDDGKRHVSLQQFFRNPDPANPVAKPLAQPRTASSGRRHEAISLEYLPEASALTLHLVGAHHKYGRGCFPDWESAAGPEGIVAERFTELQRAWGYWGLAFLEAIIKAADITVSKEEEECTQA